MKKTILFIITALYLCTASFAASLSPAIGILSKRLEMKRCITQSTCVSFEKDSFDGYFGKDTKNITVASLPDASHGTLSCKGFELMEGQVLSRDSFQLMSFTPAEGFSGQTDFSLSSGDSILTCSILVSEVLNQPPVTGAQKVDTQQNIALHTTFSAADPENDPLSYEIVKYPRHGSISVNDNAGLFIYHPEESYRGNDYFTYKAVDAFGNCSLPQKVEIKVSKPACEMYFSDMENHWAHNSAVKIAATGLMTGELSPEGNRVFCPQGDMTRGDFLALSLITAGHEKDIPYVSQTVFADDHLIPGNIKSYAQYAYDKGIINGYNNGDGSINFESSGSITRAEAAVITDKILGLEKHPLTASSAYTDAAAIPSWASGSISSLTACGIIKGAPTGEISAEKVLSRAEGAQIICNASQYLEDKQQNEKSKKKTLFNLFGLLG